MSKAEKVKQVSKLEKIDTVNIQTIDDFMLGASDKLSEPIKNTQSATVLTKPKRELPPLKKLRSAKRIVADENIEKENTTAKTV